MYSYFPWNEEDLALRTIEANNKIGMGVWSMKIMDYIIIASALAVALAFFIANTSDEELTAGQVGVYIEGKLIDSYDLAVNGEYHIDTDHGYNIVKVQDKKVEILDADCKDQICVYSAPINKAGQILVCLPHKFHVEITGAEENEVDAITN